MISIRWRLTLLLGLVIGALFIATGFAVFLSMRHLLARQFDETLTAKARALITASEIDDGDFEIDLTVQDFAGFGPQDGDDFFEIRRLDRSTFLRSPSLEPSGSLGELPASPGFSPLLYDGNLDDGRPARFYLQRFLPKDDKKERFQDLYLLVASPTRSLHLQLALLGSVLAIAGATSLFLLVPLIRLGLGRGLRPLDRLSRDLQAIPPDRLDLRLPTQRLPVELTPIASSLNEWLGRLEASFERERRFSAHAAHELRTPLAELQSLAELGATWPEEATQERCQEILQVSRELESLLEKLALLARADSGRHPLQPARFEPSSTLDPLVQRLQPRLQSRHLRLDREVADSPVHSDPLLFQTIFQNLLGNAADYAPENSTITLRRQGDRWAVSNPAPSLSAADLPHLFERFWRKDESRTGYEHSGLGLSIVRACALLLGGSVHATLSPAKLLTIELTLPDAPAPG